MSTTNNNTANYTVENLVAKYRNYVDEHCPQLSEECGPVPYKDDAEEQLLVMLYSRVAGENADKRIKEALSEYANDFYIAALDENEMSFLAEHFSDVSTLAFEYFASHRKRWYDHYVLSKNVKSILKTAYKPESGSTIFVADSGYCDVAMLFPECIVKGYTTHRGFDNDDEMWALGQIRLYAAGIRTEILSSDEILSPDYIKDVDYAIWGTAHFSSYEDAEMLCQHMKEKSRMLIFMDKNDAAGTIVGGVPDTHGLRKRMVDKCIIGSILSFEEDDELLSIQRNKICILVCNYSHATVHMQLTNGDEFDVSSELLDHEILWPSYYAAKKPEAGIPLSSIVSFVDLGRKWDNEWDKEYFIQRKEGKFVLSEKVKKMSVAALADMVAEYKDANLCEANLKLAENPIFEKWEGWIRRISQPCVLLYGRGYKYVTGYVKDLPENGIATLDTIACLVPKDGIDVRYVTALLLSPEIKGQIITISEGEVNDTTIPLIINKVIVPNHDDKERLTFLADASDNAIKGLKQEMADNVEKRISVLKADYINEVRMRKHDMSPHLLQMKSAERLMRHYIDTTTDLIELKKHLLAQVDYADNALTVISEIVEHLSEEEKFGVAEIINIDKFLEDVELNHNDREGFTIEYDCNRESFNQIGLTIPNMIEAWEKAEEQGVRYVDFVRQQTKENLPLYAEIAPIDFQRMVTNIIENARRHAFIDPSRDDYYIGIDLSLDNKTGMYQIDFSNNGNPLPEGMTKERYGIRGEKVGATAGTGSGGYIIKSIVNHYGGDYDVFTKDGITTIRIYLPIASKV